MSRLRMVCRLNASVSGRSYYEDHHDTVLGRSSGESQSWYVSMFEEKLVEKKGQGGSSG